MLAETPGREELTRRLCRSLRGHEAVAAAVEGCPARPLSTTAWASAGKPPTSQLISSVEPAAAGSRRLWRPPPALGERSSYFSTYIVVVCCTQRCIPMTSSVVAIAATYARPAHYRTRPVRPCARPAARRPGWLFQRRTGTHRRLACSAHGGAALETRNEARAARCWFVSS